LGFSFGLGGPVVEKEKAKVLIVGVDHRGWEEYFNSHIEEIWQPNFFMYNESLDPASHYKKKDVAGFGEDNIWGTLELALSGVVAITNEDMATIIGRMGAHGFRPGANLGLAFDNYLLMGYEEKYGLSHCGSKRISDIYDNFDKLTPRAMVKQLTESTNEQVIREFKLQRHIFALSVMILIETIGKADTKFARLTNQYFGGTDFTEFTTDLSWEDLDKFDLLTENIRDQWVFEELESVFVNDKYDVYVLVVGGSHVPHFHTALRERREPFMYLDMNRGIESKVVSFGELGYEDMDVAKRKIIETMNEISQFLIGSDVRRSTRFVSL
jgi:hypothetical protein